jgi:hypothetical protein
MYSTVRLRLFNTQTTSTLRLAVVSLREEDFLDDARFEDDPFSEEDPLSVEDLVLEEDSSF